MLTESRGEFSDLHYIFRFRALRYLMLETLLRIYSTARSILFSKGMFVKRALNVKGYHVFALHGEALNLPYKSEWTEYEVVRGFKGVYI